MNCPNCGAFNKDGFKFCIECGNRLKSSITNEKEPVEEVVNSTSINYPNNSTQKNNKFKKPKKRKKRLLIFLGLLVVLFIGLSLLSDFNKKPSEEKILNTEEQQLETTFEKLKKDYESGKIDVNKYFTELVYYEYDSSKLDENYKSDKTYYSTGCQSELLELLEAHKDEIDINIVRKYIENVTLHNVSLGDGTAVQAQSNSEKKYEAKILFSKKKEKEKEEDKSNAANHRLDKVILSRNENFLIWYTDTGSDAITEEQLHEISNGLENCLLKYQETFGVEYSYSPYEDAIFNDDYKNAKKVLKENGIPVDKIKSAMSVYIYDTGSEHTLASYLQPYGIYLIIDFIVQFGLHDGDGIVAFPYITINKQSISKEDESLKQLYAHELFHHFQYLFCVSTSGQPCEYETYAEGMANFASAIASEVNSTNNYLNRWAGLYTQKASTTLEKITDGASYGYGTFPYFYAYSEVVDDWSGTLMNAHNEKDDFGYVKDHTSREDLVKISEKITYGILAKNFKNKSLYSNKDISIKETIITSKKLKETINPGAMVYYVVGGAHTVIATSGNNDYVGLKLYGYKDGVYTELASSLNQIEANLTDYAGYDKFYLAFYNADIKNSNPYTLELKANKSKPNDLKPNDFAENNEFVTTFDNYNIEIAMDITMAGVTTNILSKGVVDEQHQKEYLDIATTAMGILSLNTELYQDFNTGYTYIKQPYGGDAWLKEKSATQVVDLGVLLEKLISMKNVTKIADDHYKVKMTKGDIVGLMLSGNVDLSVITGNIDVDVYTEDGYITKLEYDFSNLAKVFENFTATIKFSNYDNAGDVEIPQSIIDSIADF